VSSNYEKLKTDSNRMDRMDRIDRIKTEMINAE
jgi:hypothetical protein